MTHSHFDPVIFDRGLSRPGPAGTEAALAAVMIVAEVVVLTVFRGHTRHSQPMVDTGMRLFVILALPAALLCGCTPFIPIEDPFGTSALNPTGNIPPEFAEFNNYDPQVNAVVADQVCATPYTLLTDKSLRAAPGEIVAWSGRCEQYEIRLDNLAEHFSP